jgi:hypothetical protein
MSLFPLQHFSVTWLTVLVRRFTPTIISELGNFSRPQAQLLSTPPYFLAFFVTLRVPSRVACREEPLILTVLHFHRASALLSDKIGHRGYFNVFWMSVVAVGYAILLGVDPKQRPGVAYFALFLCVTGVVGLFLPLSWGTKLMRF